MTTKGLLGGASGSIDNIRVEAKTTKIRKQKWEVKTVGIFQATN